MLKIYFAAKQAFVDDSNLLSCLRHPMVFIVAFLDNSSQYNTSVTTPNTKHPFFGDANLVWKAALVSVQILATVASFYIETPLLIPID